MKTGYKTTEFWVTVLAILASVLVASDDLLEPKYSGIAAAIASGMYAISRSLAKRG